MALMAEIYSLTPVVETNLLALIHIHRSELFTSFTVNTSQGQQDSAKRSAALTAALAFTRPSHSFI